MTTATTHQITIESDGLDHRCHCHECRRGWSDPARQASVSHAKEHLLLTHRTTWHRPDGVFAQAVAVVKDRLAIPEHAKRLVQELDACGLLAGGFPPRHGSAADVVAAIVRWRSPKAPDGCYTDADYEQAARDLAEALDAEGLLVTLLAFAA